MIRRCLRHCLATVEAGCKEEAQKKKAENKRRKRRTAERVKSGMKSLTHEDAKPTAQRTVGQSVEQNWDCSQIEDRYEEEILDWHEGDQMEEQLDEDDKLEEILERRRVDGGSWQAEAMQKVPELAAHERMSQCKKG